MVDLLTHGARKKLSKRSNEVLLATILEAFHGAHAKLQMSTMTFFDMENSEKGRILSILHMEAFKFHLKDCPRKSTQY